MKRELWIAALVASLAIASVPLSGSRAQEDLDLGKRIFKQKAQCSQCHGWAGDGHGQLNNPAPSLRVATLDHDALLETIRCGRLGTQMPHWAKDAYTKDAASSCYGMTQAEAGDQVPPVGPAFLSDQEI